VTLTPFRTAIIARRDGARFPEAIALLEQALELDPRYARAHARLSVAHILSYNRGATDLERSLVAVEARARDATALDPTLAEPFAVLGKRNGVQEERCQGQFPLDPLPPMRKHAPGKCL
jgi:hypothetical protein